MVVTCNLYRATLYRAVSEYYCDVFLVMFNHMGARICIIGCFSVEGVRCASEQEKVLTLSLR
jgi:hypothetical protein